jgi:hypothetical protein
MRFTNFGPAGANECSQYWMQIQQLAPEDQSSAPWSSIGRHHQLSPSDLQCLAQDLRWHRRATEQLPMLRWGERGSHSPSSDGEVRKVADPCASRPHAASMRGRGAMCSTTAAVREARSPSMAVQPHRPRPARKPIQRRRMSPSQVEIRRCQWGRRSHVRSTASHQSPQLPSPPRILLLLLGSHLSWMRNTIVIPIQPGRDPICLKRISIYRARIPGIRVLPLGSAEPALSLTSSHELQADAPCRIPLTSPSFSLPEASAV